MTGVVPGAVSTERHSVDKTRSPLSPENALPGQLRHSTLFVYPKAWLRDAAMMGMAFEATGNLHVIREWILGLREVYDRNNAGEEEADNLGQALYLAETTCRPLRSRTPNWSTACLAGKRVDVAEARTNPG
jgi:GH15 family glucan-1,4-alpha-glucosidase